jgi:superfamily I DNA/RNA helicase
VAAGQEAQVQLMDDSTKLINLDSSKGAKFPPVYMPTTRGLAGKEQVLEDEARLLYVAMTHHEESVLSEKVRKAMGYWKMFDLSEWDGWLGKRQNLTADWRGSLILRNAIDRLEIKKPESLRGL